MTDPIEVKVDLTEVNQKETYAFLVQRFYGPWPKRFVGLIAVVTLLASYILASLIIGPEAFPSYGPTWFIPVAAAFLTITAFNAFFRRKLEKAVNASLYQRRPAVPIQLDKNGISARGDLIEWSFVVGIEVWDNVTLILVSPTHFLPIPHASLPPDITPVDLHARITAWREATQAPA